ncbi:hypothetical protein A2872_02755 [Candidatus Gottesmanbacteria bacterium RIFCSPHIGHO2_01_FULL_42_12]|uniref:GDP-mannose 4,6-dehydratase n=1 Tax=Candidatus Gottesmanbacteria bacterium RIFCSPHIGHO2_01_FULL_42_12 TaxID=1798377 RepID=A0A1F5Z3Z9_9BACT|nr:MAG: hypothetical protein A2872_02755 [Candidatus Gottesmanbacteria bacterium RIFCSPHIGHO2_01_FULL_42_12]
MKEKTKTAFITGVSGQDGSYLAELLLKKNYRVVGMVRRTSANTHLENIKHIRNDIEVVYGDLIDGVVLTNILLQYKPDEIYNIAAQSVPRESFKQPIHTAEITALGPVRLLEAMKQVLPKSRFYQASTCEIFGNPEGAPKKTFFDESGPFSPNNPYAIAKYYAHQMALYYRNYQKMFVSCGILFNHESPRRGTDFVSRKIVRGAVCLKLGVKNPPVNEDGKPIVQNGKLPMGTLEAIRDWGFAGDYVEAMYRILNHDRPGDFVIATGVKHTIRDFCDEAFSYLGMDYKKYVYTDPAFVRPSEIEYMVGDASKARKLLVWKPRVGFKDLVRMMVDSELAAFK